MPATRRFCFGSGPVMGAVWVALMSATMTSCGSAGDLCVEAAQRLAACTGQEAGPEFFQGCYQHIDRAAAVAGASCEQLGQGGKGDWWDWWDWLAAEEEEEAEDNVWICFVPCQATTSWREFGESSVKFVTVGSAFINFSAALETARQACRNHAALGTLERFDLNLDEQVSCRLDDPSWTCGLRCQGRTEGLEWDDESGVLFEEELSNTVSFREVYEIVTDDVRMLAAVMQEGADLSTLDAVVTYLGHGRLVEQCVSQSPRGTTVEYRVDPYDPGECTMQ